MKYFSRFVNIPNLIFIFIVIAEFGTLTLDVYSQPQNEILAVVNGRNITKAEVESFNPSQHLALDQKQLFALRKVALDNFIIKILLEKEAKRRKVSVVSLRKEFTRGTIEISDETVEKEYLKNSLYFASMSPDEVKERLRLDLESEARMQLYLKAISKLKAKAKIKILLKEPPSQSKNTDNIDSSGKPISVSRSNSGSKSDAEKKLIWLAYRKLEVYNAVAQYREGRKLEDIFKNKGGLAFTLSNFKTGNIEEIQQKLYNEMISEPSGEIIQLTRSSIQNTINGRQKDEQVVYKAEWIPGKYARAFDRNWTIGDVLKMETATYYDVERYTSFDVEVIFEGKNRKYRALVLNHGSSDNPKLEFWDAITGMGGNLTQVWKEQVLPYGIINKSDSKIRTIHNNEKFAAKIRKFLTSSGKDSYTDNRSFACPSNSKELRQCCISSTLAEFWEIDACNAWESDANLLISNTSITSNLADIQFYSSDHQYQFGGGSHFGRS